MRFTSPEPQTAVVTSNSKKIVSGESSKPTNLAVFGENSDMREAQTQIWSTSKQGNDMQSPGVYVSPRSGNVKRSATPKAIKRKINLADVDRYVGRINQL